MVPSLKQSWVPNIVLDNIDNTGPSNKVVSTDDGVVMLTAAHVDNWGAGNVYTHEQVNGTDKKQSGYLGKIVKCPSLLGPDKKRYFAKEKPQFENILPGKFYNVLRFNVSNKGETDPGTARQNTIRIQLALDAAVAGDEHVPVVFPAGVYAIDDTIKIPLGSRLVGIGWPQLMAVGPKFQDRGTPKVFLQVGGDSSTMNNGTIEIMDIIVTGKGPLAGAKYIEWNAHEKETGSAAMWEVAVRIGGAQGTDLQTKQCHKDISMDKKYHPRVWKRTNQRRCFAGLIMLHVTKLASIYMENMWLWVAGTPFNAVV